jgi:hypothetical protein
MATQPWSLASTIWVAPRFGRYGEMYLRFTDVLVRRDGRWQLVARQATQTSGF